MAGIFKAYDVRGLYPSQIDETITRKIGAAFFRVLEEAGFPRGREVVVSRDMRSHSVPLSKALIEGLREGGLDVVDIGLAPTPMNYFAVGSLGVAGGVQVTASHNPAGYNGLKFSLHEARPVSGDTGLKLMEQIVASGELPEAATPGAYRTADVRSAYEAKLTSFLEPGRRLKVVADAANGMGTVDRSLLESWGIDLIPLYFELDGTFPNHEANPLKLENLRDLSRAVLEHQADLGISFDGDADRAAFVDERGEPVGSDLATALVAGALLEREPGLAVVYDLRSSRATAEWISEKGGVPIRERVGHSFMKATLREHQGLCGGELAGHYYFRDTYYADSALLAVVEILNLLRRERLTMSELVAPLERYAKTPEINFEVEDKTGTIERLRERFADGEIDFLDGITVQYPDWWFNVRPSNTEPLLRLVLEASNAADRDRRTAELIGLIGSEPV